MRRILLTSFSCAGWISTQPCPVSMGTLNLMPYLCMLITLAICLWEVLRWPVTRQSFCPKSLQPHFQVMVNISPTFIQNGLYFRIYLLFLLLICYSFNLNQFANGRLTTNNQSLTCMPHCFIFLCRWVTMYMTHLFFYYLFR